MRKLLPILLWSVILSCGDSDFKIRPGDLLFQQWDGTSFAEAINKVTHGRDNIDYAHVGLVVEDEGKLWVLEAIQTEGVTLTPLDTFLYASTTESGLPRVSVGRLQADYSEAIPDILNWAQGKLDYAYDTLFVYGNDRYYCSELLLDAFNSQTGEEVFSLASMTFKDPESKEFFSVWVKYFAELNKPIPEGMPGINPGLMSRSEKLDIVHHYFQKKKR